MLAPVGVLVLAGREAEAGDTRCTLSTVEAGGAPPGLAVLVLLPAVVWAGGEEEGAVLWQAAGSDPALEVQVRLPGVPRVIRWATLDPKGPFEPPAIALV